MKKGTRVVLDSPYGKLVISGGEPGYEPIPNGAVGVILSAGPKGKGWVVDFPSARVVVPSHWVKEEGEVVT